MAPREQAFYNKQARDKFPLVAAEATIGEVMADRHSLLWASVEDSVTPGGVANCIPSN